MAAAEFIFELATLKYPLLTLRPIAGAVGGPRTQFRDAPQIREQGSSDAIRRSTAVETLRSSTGGYLTEVRRAGDGFTRFWRAKRHVGSQMRPISSTVAAAAAATAVLQQQLIQQQLLHYCSSSYCTTAAAATAAVATAAVATEAAATAAFDGIANFLLTNLFSLCFYIRFFTMNRRSQICHCSTVQQCCDIQRYVVLECHPRHVAAWRPAC